VVVTAAIVLATVVALRRGHKTIEDIIESQHPPYDGAAQPLLATPLGPTYGIVGDVPTDARASATSVDGDCGDGSDAVESTGVGIARSDGAAGDAASAARSEADIV